MHQVGYNTLQQYLECIVTAWSAITTQYNADWVAASYSSQLWSSVNSQSAELQQSEKRIFPVVLPIVCSVWARYDADKKDRKDSCSHPSRNDGGE